MEENNPVNKFFKNPGEKGLFEILEEEKGSSLTDEEIDSVLKKIDIQKNEEDFYVDAFDNTISFAGIRTIKKENTILKLSEIHKNEILKCSKDFKYFRKFYCKIVTKSGIGRPEPREYQEKLEDNYLSGKDNVLLFGRQTGKCLHFSSKINVKKGDIKMKLSIGVFHKIDEIEKYSKMKPKSEKYKMNIKKFFKTKLFSDMKIEDLTEFQKEQLNELFEVVNNISFQYKPAWIKKFIIGDVQESYVLRTLRYLKIYEYNKNFNESFTKLLEEKEGIK